MSGIKTILYKIKMENNNKPPGTVSKWFQSLISFNIFLSLIIFKVKGYIFCDFRTPLKVVFFLLIHKINVKLKVVLVITSKTLI